MAPPSQHYIKSELLPCIGATNRAIRSTVGTVISVLFQIVRVAGWIELFQALHKCLDSNDLDHMEGAMDAIYKVMCTPVILRFYTLNQLDVVYLAICSLMTDL